MCNKVCHMVAENALTVNCSVIFKHKHECSGQFVGFFSLTIKVMRNISLPFKI